MEKTKKVLETLFVPRDKQLDGVCFNFEYMKPEHENYPIYEAVSKVMFDSQLTHSFAYEIASKAVYIIGEATEEQIAGYDFSEAVDQAVPIYTSELMEIYRNDHSAVDTACEEMGIDPSADSVARAQAGWYMLIERMTRDITEALTALNA